MRGETSEKNGLAVVAPISDDARLDVGKHHFLLRAVEAVQLIDEQRGASAAGASRSRAWSRAARSSLTPQGPH